MRGKRILAAALTFAMSTSCLTGFSAPAFAAASDKGYATIYRNAQSKAAAAPATATKTQMVGVTMTADGDQLTIGRAKPGGAKPASVDEGWTIFVYFCGSDLETDVSAATENIADMVAAEGSENVRFVIQTGGAKKWDLEGADAKELDRFLIQENAISKVEAVPEKDMGDPATLQDFVTWGVKNYPSEHMGLVLWNHGGGSVGGVCFDELNGFDSLSLPDLDTALAGSFAQMWKKLDFIGFDACLMSTIEVANVCATYADYLYGSQENEPGGGWGFYEIGSFLAKNPNADARALGKAVADSYVSHNAQDDTEKLTFAITDLSKIDSLLRAFHKAASEIFANTSAIDKLTDLTRAVLGVDKFGSNNKTEGYTDMVDLAGLMAVSAPWSKSAAEAGKALESAIAYKTDQAAHAHAGGLSVYWPLDGLDDEVLNTMSKIAASPAYLSLVERNAYGAENGTIDGYVPDAGSTKTTTGTKSPSRLVSFAEAPHLDESGTYSFKLTESALDATVAVSALLLTPSADGSDYLSLGETYDVDADWETGIFADDFDGLWLSLPDGQNLCAYPEDFTDDYVLYTAPIMLNGEESYLRVRVYDDFSTLVEGAYDGIDEYGAAGRGVTDIVAGDEIVPLYDSYSATDEEQGTYQGVAYKVTGDLKPEFPTVYQATSVRLIASGHLRPKAS